MGAFVESVAKMIVDSGIGAAAKRLTGSTIIGSMIILTKEGLEIIDKEFTDADNSALKLARSRNGGCEHILLAYSSNTWSSDAPGEANSGNRTKTVQIGKRFSYSDTTYLFWHPSVAFLPDGPVSAVYIGTSEQKKETASGPSISSAPRRGRYTCPQCVKNIKQQAEELAEFLKNSSK